MTAAGSLRRACPTLAAMAGRAIALLPRFALSNAQVMVDSTKSKWRAIYKCKLPEIRDCACRCRMRQAWKWKGHDREWQRGRCCERQRIPTSHEGLMMLLLSLRAWSLPQIRGGKSRYVGSQGDEADVVIVDESMQSGDN